MPLLLVRGNGDLGRWKFCARGKCLRSECQRGNSYISRAAAEHIKLSEKLGYYMATHLARVLHRETSKAISASANSGSRVIHILPFGLRVFVL